MMARRIQLLMKRYVSLLATVAALGLGFQTMHAATGVRVPRAAWTTHRRCREHEDP